jgi:excinuclease ABC subunit C
MLGKIGAMGEAAIFEQVMEFAPGRAEEVLRRAPAGCGVFALYGAGESDRPYLAKSGNIRRRLQRLLEPSEGQTKRLNLRDRIARVAWSRTGSDFESVLLLYRASSEAFGRDETCKRLKLYPPYVVRFTVENRFPRMYVTSRLGRRTLHTSYGPFASRASAERYVDGVNELFHLRRCHEELVPFPEHPGCAYGEMKKCSAPCQARVTDDEYRSEADAVLDFLATRGESLLEKIAAEREKASEEMEFEAAAAAHERYVEVKATAALAGELVRPLDELRGVIFLPAAEDAATIQIWLMRGGCLHGPEQFSTLGVRVAREQAEVGTSLFAQPLMLEAVPLDGPAATGESAEERLLGAIARLENGQPAHDVSVMADHLAMLKRWYYRPEAKRIGVVCFPEGDTWPVRKMVRASAKVGLKSMPIVPTEVAPATQNGG